MATANQPYYDCIKRTLHGALCLASFPSPVVERHNKPEIEVQTSPEVILNPITICNDEYERVLIETSINSVRVSVTFRKGDATASLVGERIADFLTQRAERFHVLRRKPVEGFDISFLVTNEEAETMHKNKIVDFIVQFISDISKDIAATKMVINQRARLVATEWFSSTVPDKIKD